jgi:hypothetical protein
MSTMPSAARRALDARIRSAFLAQCVRVPVACLVPLKAPPAHVKQTTKYLQIVASVRDVGLIEPPAVIPIADRPGYFHVLDGNLRVEALKELQVQEVDCMLATDDDTYSYNRRVARLGAVQEHLMVMRACDRGVSPERIAAALGLKPEAVRVRFRMLNGICDEAVALLADKPCPAVVLNFLRRMKPIRQIEAAELMVGQKNFGTPFAQAILMATPESELVTPAADDEPTPARASARSMARLQGEVTSLQMRNHTAEEEYGPDVLKLTIARTYLAALVANAPVAEWLALHRPEYLKEFQRLAEVPSVKPGSPNTIESAAEALKL